MNKKQRLITAAETRVRVAIRNAQAWQHDVPPLNVSTLYFTYIELGGRQSYGKLLSEEQAAANKEKANGHHARRP